MVSDSELKVAVLGLGYIGLPTAAIIARTGVQVLGVDVTQSVVDTVNSGKVHIEEVDLDGLVSGVVARGLRRAQPDIDRDAGCAQLRMSLATDVRIGVLDRRHHAGKPGCDHGIRTGRRTAEMRAGF